MMAAKVGNIEMVEMLLPFSNVEDVDVNGWRAIEHAGKTVGVMKRKRL